MQLTKIFAIAMCIAGTALAQMQDDELRLKLASVHYPTLAAAARVQGDLHLTLTSGVVNLLSGPPLLAQTTIQNTKSLPSNLDGTTLDVVYHFILINPASESTSTIVKKGDAFDRIVLRMFGLKTEKTVIEYQCDEGVAPPANDINISGTKIEVWIYGRGHCLNTETGTLITRS